MERKLIAAAVSSALALPMAAQAVEFAVYGQLNRAVISVDGGASDGDLQHVDANASQSRFGFKGSEELESGLTAGVTLEYGLGAAVRHANAYISSAGGKLTVGHGSRATDGMAHAYLGGPSWLGGATPWCAFHSPKNAYKEPSNPACPTNDGGRGPMLRYDTPAIGPASIAISSADNDYWDVMLKISGSMGDAGYDLRIGHIGEYDSTMVVPAVKGKAGTVGSPGMDAVPAGQNISRINGSNLEDLLAMENSAADASFYDTFWTVGTDGDAGTDDDERVEVVVLGGDPAAGGLGAINAHIEASEGTVVGIDGVNTLNNTDIGAATTAFYKTETTAEVDAVAAVADVAATPYMPETTKPAKAGDITTASAAFSFGQGTSVAVAWSQDHLKDHEYQYIKLDHSYGAGSVGVYYKTGENKDGTSGSLAGIAVGHDMGGGATAYAGYRRMSEDKKEDIDLLVAGLLVTFN